MGSKSILQVVPEECIMNAHDDRKEAQTMHFCQQLFVQNEVNANMAYRKSLKDRKRIVIKIGSSSLLHPETGRLNYHRIDHLAEEL